MRPLYRDQPKTLTATNPRLLLWVSTTPVSHYLALDTAPHRRE